jgi:hypothetical protein
MPAWPRGRLERVLQRLVAHYRFDRPVLVLRLAGLIVGGVTLHGALVYVLAWMGVCNGVLRHGFFFTPSGGWWSLVRPDAVGLFAGCLLAAVLAGAPGSSMGWLTRRMAR